MTRTKIIHTGDWHCCSSQYGKRTRADAIFESALNVCRTTAKKKIDTIINTGDILDASTIRSYPLYQLDRIHELLLELGITMYTLTGNHDMDNPTWISRYNDSSGKGIVNIDNEIIELPDGSRLVGFMTKTVKELFERLALGDWRDTDIAVWHGGVAEFTGGAFGRYPTAKEIWDASPIRNWLLGDIHVCQFITPPEGGIMGYPGPIEMTDIDENPKKYICEIEFDKGSYVENSLKKIPLITAPVIVIPLTSDKEVDEARNTLKSTLGVPRMIWFHFEDQHQAAMNDLHSLTTPEDVIREKNVTVRKVSEIMERPEEVNVDIYQVTDEETEGLPDDMRELTKNIVNKTGTPQVLLEKLLTQHESSFI